MKIEINTANPFGGVTILNGYVIGPVVYDKFLLNGISLQFYSTSEADKAREDLIKKLEADNETN